MKNSETVRLVGDIGGTNARLAWVDDEDHIHQVQEFACANYRGLLPIYQAYCEQHNIQPSSVCFAVAGPCVGDQVIISNLGWKFSIAQMQQDMAVQNLLLVNDFHALARALPILKAENLHLLIAAPGEAGGVRAVIGPGTGLGAAAILPTVSGWQVLAGEGGHMTLSLRTDRDADLWRLLRREHERISAERVLSGPGIVTLYRGLCALEGLEANLQQPAAVVQAARQGDDLASEALQMFCAFLGDVAGNFALCLGATGGVYLGGGILPRMVDILSKSEFQQRFHNRGRADAFIRQIPVYVICAPYPALAGCAALLKLTDRNSVGEKTVIPDRQR